MKKLFCVLFLSAIGLYAADKKTEAEAFFREYLNEMSRFKTAWNIVPEGWQETGKKIAAAAALEPDNLLYRHTNIFHQACFVLQPGLQGAERVAIYRNFLEQAKSLRQTWPNYQELGVKSLFSNPHIAVGAFNPRGIQDFRKSISASERAEIASIFAEFSALLASERAARREAVGERFKNRMEMIFFISAMADPVNMLIDNRSTFQASFDVEMEILKRYVHSSSEFVCQQDTYPTRFPYLVDRGETDDFAETVALLKKLLADPEYQELLRSIKRKEYDLRLLEIQAILEYVSSDLSPDSLKRVCREYFKKLEQFTGSKANNDFISSYFGCLREICFWTLNNVAPKDDFWEIAKQALRECDDRADKVLSDEEFLLAFREQIVSRRVTIPDPLGELRSRAGSLKQLKNHLLLRSNPLDVAYMTMGDFLFNIGNEAGKTTIDTLFPEFEIRFYRHPEAVADVRYSCGNEKNIYFLDCDDLSSFSLANQQFTNLPQLPKYHRHRNFVYDEAGYCLAWCADCIAVYDIARKHWSLIEDLSGDEIAGCAVVGKRLFYLLGGDLSPIALHSCDLQGNKRKLHFSSRRRGGIAEFKGVTNGFTSQLVKNSASSLAFIMIAQNRQQGGLFFFDTEKETLSLHRNLPRMMGMKPYLQKLANGGLFGSNSRGYFMLRDKFEVFLKFTSPNPRQSNPEQARYALVMNDRPLLPCILMQDEILISSENRLLINLKNPDATPFIWLPYSDTVVQIAPDQFLLPVYIGVYTFKIKK